MTFLSNSAPTPFPRCAATTPMPHSPACLMASISLGVISAHPMTSPSTTATYWAKLLSIFLRMRSETIESEGGLNVSKYSFRLQRYSARCEILECRFAQWSLLKAFCSLQLQKIRPRTQVSKHVDFRKYTPSACRRLQPTIDNAIYTESGCPMGTLLRRILRDVHALGWMILLVVF